MVGWKNGWMKKLEQLLIRSLGPVVGRCLQALFRWIDGSSLRPTPFSGDIGKCIADPVEKLQVPTFSTIECDGFPEMARVESSLSNDMPSVSIVLRQ